MENITDETTSYPALFSVLALLNYLDKNYSFLISTLSVKFFVAGASVLFIYFIAKLWTTGCREQGLPPGPPVTPVVGNALQFPTGFPHIRFTEWAYTYGPIVSVEILNRTIIVLTDPEAVKAILDGQGALTGNRPRSYIIQRVTDGLYMALEDMHTPIWKHNRKAIHSFMSPSQLEAYLPKQQVEYVHFLHDILTQPQDIYTHIRRTTASVMTTLIYGKRCFQWSGSDAEIFFEGAKLFNNVIDPGAHPPIDLFWPLKYVPYVERWGWAKWKPLCDTTKSVRDALYIRLLEECEERLKSGQAVGCYIETILNNQADLGITRDEICGLGTVLMDGGAETTASYIQNFIISMLQSPESQRRAQKEIDSVVGGDRFPVLADFERLPYIKALVKEVFRFRTIFPVGVPHVTTEDITCKGYHIPRDSIIFMNIWGIYHHPDYFDEPETFKPERYLNNPHGTKKGVNTTGFRDNLPFGAGRRICPGEVMGMRTIMLNTMNLLWAFNFAKDKPGTGNWDIDSYAGPGLELTPLPFTCTITPRDEKRVNLIKQSFEYNGESI